MISRIEKGYVQNPTEKLSSSILIFNTLAILSFEIENIPYLFDQYVDPFNRSIF